jgi:hypothetical protein
MTLKRLAARIAPYQARRRPLNKVLVAALLSVLACLAWAVYGLIDAGGAMTASKVSEQRMTDEVIQLRSMLRHLALDRDRAELQRLLAADIERASIVKSEADGLYVGDVGFVFRDGRLADIRLLHEPQR